MNEMNNNRKDPQQHNHSQNIIMATEKDEERKTQQPKQDPKKSMNKTENFSHDPKTNQKI